MERERESGVKSGKMEGEVRQGTQQTPVRSGGGEAGGGGGGGDGGGSVEGRPLGKWRCTKPLLTCIVPR